MKSTQIKNQPCHVNKGVFTHCIGKIFAVLAWYEVAFTALPPSNKVLACRVNIFA